MSESLIKLKSHKFAVEIVFLYKSLVEKHKEYVLSKQILKSGTSIAANIREAKYAQSTNDFISKFSIALKETEETLFWLELLYETGYISENDFKLIYDNCNQKKKIITSIIVTTKNRKNS